MTISIDWRSLMGDDAYARCEAERTEIARIHALPDRWLAAELLKLARSARKERPDLGDPFAHTYGTSFVWHVVPEIARRLGGRLLPNESADPETRAAGGPELRRIVGCHLANNEIDRRRDPSTGNRRVPDAVDMLGRNPANGNPAAIGLDRIQPPSAGMAPREDWTARTVQEAARNRGHGDVSEWSPDLNGPPVEECEVEERASFRP